MKTKNILNLGEAKTSQRKAGFFLIAISTVMLTLTSCEKSGDIQNSENDAEDDIVYVESNNYLSNQNSILAYRHKGDGKLEQIPGSPFLTNGSGVGNPEQILGPNDSDTPLIFSPDRKFLLGVNSGSNSIAVFRIQSDGSLKAVPGSPFSSCGETPVSLDFCHGFLFVVNKSQDPLHPSKNKPNYRTFTMDDNGALTQVKGGIFEASVGSSPTQALVSNDDKFLFGADFLGFMLTPPEGMLRSFKINSSGILTPVKGTPLPIPGAGPALGLWQHPKANTLYVGFPGQAKVGVYSIESTGELTFKTAVDAGPAACWIRTTKNGEYMYSLNSAENSISIFNTSNSLSPTSIDKFTLKISGPGTPASSQPFHLDFSPSEKHLYVLNQHANKDFTIGNFNYLHILSVGSDGRLSEPGDPLQLPVAANVRPQGVAVY